MRHRLRHPLIWPSLTVLALVILNGPSSADVPQIGGEVVVTSPEATCRSGNQNVPIGREFQRFHVRQVKSPWIYIGSDRARGWVRADDIVPLGNAETLYTEMLSRDSSQTWARQWRAAVRANNGNVTGAIADLDEILTHNSMDVSALLLRGIVRHQNKDYDLALADFNRAAELAPQDVRVLYNRALTRQAKKQAEKADADLSEAIRINPNDSEAFRVRGIVHLDEGNFDDALSDLNTAVNLNSQSAVAFLHRGVVRFHRDELYWSLADLNEAIRLEPTLAEAHFYRGHVQYRLLDYSGTLESYRAALRLNPNDTDKMNQLAWVLATCPDVGIRDGKQAVELARKAQELAKDEDPDLLDTLAASLAEDGRFEEAISVQDKAVKLYTPDDPGRADATKRAALYRTGQAFRWEP